MTLAVRRSTDDLPLCERGPAWREWIWTRFGALASGLPEDNSFDGHLSTSNAGDVIFTRLDAGRHCVLRQPGRSRGVSDAGYLKVVAPWQGSACVEQHGRRASASPGSWIIYDTTGDYRVDNPGDVRHLVVMLPKDRMAERGLRLDALMGREIGAVSGIGRVALDTLRSTWQELPGMGDDTARGAGEMVMQLLHLSLLELSGQSTLVTQRAALKDRIRTHVARNLRDPQLSIERIAQALNCSKRHLHNAFADEEETLASYILRQRLEACIRELRQGGQGARPITDIALYWGFNNLSHFSRVFREHTGSSPSAYRSTPPPLYLS